MNNCLLWCSYVEWFSRISLTFFVQYISIMKVENLLKCALRGIEISENLQVLHYYSRVGKQSKRKAAEKQQMLFTALVDLSVGITCAVPMLKLLTLIPPLFFLFLFFCSENACLLRLLHKFMST